MILVFQSPLFLSFWFSDLFKMVNELLVTVQLLIIYGFAYSLQFVIPKSILAAFSVIPRYAQSSKKTEFPDARSLSFGQIRDTTHFCFSSHTINKYALHSLFSATFFIFLCFLLVISPPNWFPIIVLQCNLGFLNTRRLRCGLWNKYVLDKLHLGMSYSAIGCEFIANE